MSATLTGIEIYDKTITKFFSDGTSATLSNDDNFIMRKVLDEEMSAKCCRPPVEFWIGHKVIRKRWKGVKRVVS